MSNATTTNPRDHATLIGDLLAFYRRELVESADGREALGKVGIREPALIERLGLGWASGRAIATLSESRYGYLCSLGLAQRRTDRMFGCVVLPVRDASGELLDLHGLRPWQSGLRFVSWQTPGRGMIGGEAVKRCGDEHDGELILCDNAFHYLHAIQHGYANAAAIRTLDELAGHVPLLTECGVERVYVVSRQQREAIGATLGKAGIEAVYVKTPARAIIVPADCYRDAMTPAPAPGRGKRTTAQAPAPSAPSAEPVEQPAPAQVEAVADGGVALVERTDHRLTFRVGDTTYHVESAAVTGITMRAQVRIGRRGATHIDRMDLASASSRRKVARHAATRLGLGTGEVEDHLTAIADRIDRLMVEAAGVIANGRGGRASGGEPMSDADRQRAMVVLRGGDVLAYLGEAVEAGSGESGGSGGFVGEEANKRLAILVAASRLLPRPLGALIRGPAGCGKSSLMAAIRGTLPADQVLYFSRLTPQALYYLPPEELTHKLLVCDEYAGMADSEYAVRSMMSSQTLSLATTVREGNGSGGMPVTRSIEVPATVAVMVSTTAGVNIENLSRFIEIGLSDSIEQTRRVMSALAHRGTNPRNGSGNADASIGARHVNALLRPCSVVIPYADQLTYAGGGVLARRRFAQIIGLIASHAALHQHQRPHPRKQDDGERLVIEATKADYAAVYVLLPGVVDHFEESLTPAAMRLLRHVSAAKLERITIREAMESMGWSYSTARRVLCDLHTLDLAIPDHTANGIQRTYTLAPFQLLAPGSEGDTGVATITPPEAIE